jgi:hypothetical protein
MNLPSKSVSYEESVLSKFPLVLRAMSEKEISPLALYYEVENGFIDIAEFVDALDCLFALGKIILDADKGVLRRVG